MNKDLLLCFAYAKENKDKDIVAKHDIDYWKFILKEHDKESLDFDKFDIILEKDLEKQDNVVDYINHLIDKYNGIAILSLNEDNGELEILTKTAILKFLHFLKRMKEMTVKDYLAYYLNNHKFGKE